MPFQSLKEGQLISLELVTGRRLAGRLKGFDLHTVLLESEGRAILIYKHAIVTVAVDGTSDPPECYPPPRRPPAAPRLGSSAPEVEELPRLEVRLAEEPDPRRNRGL